MTAPPNRGPDAQKAVGYKCASVRPSIFNCDWKPPRIFLHIFLYHQDEGRKKEEEAQNASVTVSTEYSIKCKNKQKKALKKYNETHASTALATNKSRQTPLCQCEVLQIIKLTDCLKDLKNKNKKKLK